MTVKGAMGMISEHEKRYNHKRSSMDISIPRFNTVKKTLEDIRGHSQDPNVKTACNRALFELDSALVQIQSDI